MKLDNIFTADIFGSFYQNHILLKRALCQKVKDETLSTIHFPKLQFTFHARKLCANNDVACGKIYILQKRKEQLDTLLPLNPRKSCE